MMMVSVFLPEKTHLPRARPPTNALLIKDAKRVKLAAGELGIDIYNMRPALTEAGFHYVETLDDLGEFNGIDCPNRD